MSIYDPLYGRFELSAISQELCVLPEVRRLSQIRLLNCISPTLATLSELRRYAHTLGVLHLFNIWKKAAGRRYPKEEQDALEVAIILHDVATPPFGHLFEYILKEATGWDHEAAAVTTLLKAYSPASTAQAIYAGKTPKVLDHIERRGVNLELVKAILTKKHRLTSLIMGVVDFDNLDNVWRMAWALGLPGATKSPEALAEVLDVNDGGGLLMEKSMLEELRRWARLRRAVYDVLVFDQPTVASQTVLTYCIREGIKQGKISSDDWFLHDESLLLKLSEDPAIKALIELQYLGRLPEPVFTVQMRWKDSAFFSLSRIEIEKALALKLTEVAADSLWIYVFKERGSFEKLVKYSLNGEGSATLGEVSQSLVISVFSRKQLSRSQQRAATAVVVSFLEEYNVSVNDFMRVIEAGDESIAPDGRLAF